MTILFLSISIIIIIENVLRVVFFCFCIVQPHVLLLFCVSVSIIQRFSVLSSFIDSFSAVLNVFGIKKNVFSVSNVPILLVEDHKSKNNEMMSAHVLCACYLIIPWEVTFNFFSLKAFFFFLALSRFFLSIQVSRVKKSTIIHCSAYRWLFFSYFFVIKVFFSRMSIADFMVSHVMLGFEIHSFSVDLKIGIFGGSAVTKPEIKRIKFNVLYFAKSKKND